MNVVDSVVDLIGRTPLVRLQRLTEPDQAEVWVKLEKFNPGGSVKDRISRSMIEEAEREGKLKSGGTIVEATSGNTGIGLALIAAARGYRLILIMPETMSQERRDLLEGYGAEVLLTPGEEGMEGSIQKAERLIADNPEYFMPRQFENTANPAAHRRTTALEIMEQTSGRLQAFVAGIGTGGTITGVGEVLKTKLPGVKVIGVEPATSAVINGHEAGPHRIQGIGAGFIPPVLKMEFLDKVITVRDEDAFITSLNLARQEGIFAGISSGAALFGALKVARELGPGQKVVAILPDTGERYFSLWPVF